VILLDKKKSYCNNCKEVQNFIRPNKFYMCLVCGKSVSDYSQAEMSHAVSKKENL